MLPMIDVSDLSHERALSYQRIGAEICQACEQVGFFYITGHGISDATVQAAVRASSEFFAQPTELKKSVAVNLVNRGYMGFGECVLPNAQSACLKEVFFWGPESTASTSLPLVGCNRWPETLPAMREPVIAYYEAVTACAQRLLKAIACGLGLAPDFFAPYYRSPLARGQLLHYPVPPGQADKSVFGASPHCDFGCLTVLWQDENGGLEVRVAQGDWVSAPPVAGSLVVNIGDLLAFWTGGRLRSTVHRVRNLSRNERYSIAVFYDPASDALIDPAATGFGSHAEPVTAGDFIQSRNRRSFAHYRALDVTP